MAAESLRRHLLAVRAEHVQDGAVLVVDNAGGEVLAYVGGSGDLGSARHVDGICARRPAGSTLKPFLYAEALDRRLLTAASLLEDTPLDLAVAGGSTGRGTTTRAGRGW
jgi:penicillin-binding protein 1C